MVIESAANDAENEATKCAITITNGTHSVRRFPFYVLAWLVCCKSMCQLDGMEPDDFYVIWAISDVEMVWPLDKMPKNLSIRYVVRCMDKKRYIFQHTSHTLPISLMLLSTQDQIQLFLSRDPELNNTLFTRDTKTEEMCAKISFERWFEDFCFPN